MEKIIIKLPYIDKITVAQKIRPKYYHKSKFKPYTNKDLPKRFKSDKYSINENGFIIDSSTKEQIISNSRKAGEARFWIVNFQSIYNGSLNKHARNNYLIKLKDLLKDTVDEIPIITEFPIKIEFFIYSNEMPVDLGNKSPCYYKVFEDLLQDLGKIPNDSSEYIQDTGRTKWIPTPKHKEKMEFHISKIED